MFSCLLMFLFFCEWAFIIIKLVSTFSDFYENKCILSIPLEVQHFIPHLKLGDRCLNTHYHCDGSIFLKFRYENRTIFLMCVTILNHASIRSHKFHNQLKGPIQDEFFSVHADQMWQSISWLYSYMTFTTHLEWHPKDIVTIKVKYLQNIL